MKNGLIGMCALAMILRAKEGGEGGGALLEEKEFQDKVFKTVGGQQQSIDDLTSNFDNLQKETKKEFEAFTKAKNSDNATLEELKQGFQKVTLALNREKKMAFGNPMQRISNDDDKRARFNAAVRHFSNFNGDLSKTVNAIIGKDASEGAGFGATLINTDLAKDIYDTLAIYGAWNTLGVRNLGTLATKLPVKTARAAGQWLTAEGATIPEDASKAGTTVTILVEPIAVLLSVSMQLLQDAEMDVTADIMDDFSEAWNYVLDYTAFNGDGTADANNGGYTGVFNSGIASVAAATHTTVAGLAFEDFTKTQMSVDPGVLTRATRWWMHPFVLIKSLSVKDLNGRPIFLTALEAPSPGALGSILGSPVTPVLAAPYADGASAKVAAFGDPKAYTVGVRTDFQFDYSDHAKWSTWERSFRGVGRAGCVMRRAQGLSVLTLAAA